MRFSLPRRFLVVAVLIAWATGGLRADEAMGAYLAVTGAFGPATGGMVLLAAAVLFWTAGFDVLYACQDVEHDRTRL